MSLETDQWLNRNVLVGYTDKRGLAWHYKASEQGTEPNHYPGAIPVADVLRRLFTWEAEPVPIFQRVPCELDDPTLSGVEESGRGYKYVAIEDKKAWRANDTNEVLGIFSDDYFGHQYSEWLVKNVANILDDDLGIGSAGLLSKRAQAFVTVEVPENIKTPEGVEFRPNLVACTSFNGSLATTYKRVVTNIVCDNTLRAGLGESGQEFRLRHTKNSGLRIADARDALAIIHSASDDFTAEVAELCAQVVTDKQWAAVLDALAPAGEEGAESKAGKATSTKRDHKRDTLETLWRSDRRVSPWQGTAYGVLQAFNTYNHHYASARNASRVERNLTNAITGATFDADAEVLKTLALVSA